MPSYAKYRSKGDCTKYEEHNGTKDSRQNNPIIRAHTDEDVRTSTSLLILVPHTT